MKTDLSTYVPKGEIENFPMEIIAKMLEHQVAQARPENIAIFENFISDERLGFDWTKTPEGWDFWRRIIMHNLFDVFYKKYPLFDPKRGDIVLVSSVKGSWSERIYVTIIEGTTEPYVCVHESDNSMFKDGKPFRVCQWARIKQKDPQVYLSLQDISDGKGVGVPAHLIVIKS